MNRAWRTLLVLVSILVVTQPLTAAEPTAPVTIGTRTCLFLDDRFIAEQSGLKRTWHQGQPRSEPAIVADQPWEKWPHAFGSVLYDPDAKRYKLWYEDIPARGAVLYAESLDGKTWIKPKLGLFELKGTKDNNCVLYPAELPNVFLDPNEKDRQACFKMFAWGGPFGDKKVTGHVLFGSADGIHWNLIQGVGLPATTDETAQARTVRDTNQVFWDSLGQRYLGTYRTFPLHPGLPGWTRDEKYQTLPKIGGHRRAVGITTAKSLTGPWSPVVTVLKADAQDDEKARRLSRTPDPDFVELYIMPAFVYGNHYLGMVSLLFQVDAAPGTMSKSTPVDKRSDTQVGGGDVQLTFSHDGMKWFRQPDRQTLIAPSPSKLVPCYAPCNPPLELGDELWLYYTEAQSAHPAPDHKANLRAAVWRKDGFASLDAADRAMLTTRPFLVEGKSLALNMKALQGGEVRVAILDEAGKPVPGYELKDCEPLHGDQVNGVVRWSGQSDLSPLKGKAVRLHMELSKCNLYGFRLNGD